MTITPHIGQILLDIQGLGLTLGNNEILRGLVATVFDLQDPEEDPEKKQKRGQVVAILAPSGIGKTLLFELISGIRKPTTGTIRLGIDGVSPQPGQVGVVAQNYPLFDHRKVLDNLMRALHKSKLSRKEKRAAAMKILEQFNLVDRADFYPQQLSGGQRQRVAIAQQLLCSTDLILMDEPFSGQDPLAKSEVVNLIIEVANEDEYNTVMVVTHDVAAAVAVADTIWLIGRDRDENGAFIPGASIQRVYDLVPMQLAWLKGDVRMQDSFHDFVMEIEAEFRNL